nr:fasciclin-like arabinogalactan protein 4 [Centaurium erythraea]
METKQLLHMLAIHLFIIIINSNNILAQAPTPAPGPPPPPTNITAILEKANRFTTFIRLLQKTQTADRINTQLNNSNSGLTIFAPTDSAFANLQSLSLNSRTDQQKSELVQFHILSSFYSLPQFQTASDPLSTEAGGTDYGEFPVNITTSGNSVNISTGFANASVQNTVYTDNQLAVYEVDQVLLPQKFFVAPPPVIAPAPAPPKHKKGANSNSDENAIANSSNTLCLFKKMFYTLYAISVLAFTLRM